MSDDFEKRAIIQALQSRTGMPAEDALRLDEFNAKQTDWYTTCPRCKTALRGSLAELKAHHCGN